jgi:DNA-binding response OmpR family regulator
VITASSGEETLELLKGEKPDLILLDIKMSGLDGIETLKKIKGIDSSLNVIMVTGKKPEEENALKRCGELGALNYIHKPLEMDELENIVLSQLKKRG